jgi:hypothetical protein
LTEEHPPKEKAADWFRDLLDDLGRKADAMIADYLAQDPKTIDLVGRVGSLPGKVFDVVVAMRDDLNESSQAALQEYEDKKTERFRALTADYEQYLAPQREMMRWAEEQNELRRKMYEIQESPIVKAMREWEAQEAERARKLWEQLEESERRFQASLPPNWNDPEVEFPDLEDLEELQLREGLPLAWVPPNRVLAEVLGASTAAARRRIIGRESEAILRACLKELRRLRSDETTPWRTSARQAAEAMKAGHWRAGQALAAITLDTATDRFVRSSYSDATLQSRKGKGAVRVATPPGTSERSLPTWRDVDYPRALLVLHSLYGAFREYSPQQGVEVPTQFTRHGTVHTISQRQYSRPNALIAIMHIVGLLCLIEDD